MKIYNINNQLCNRLNVNAVGKCTVNSETQIFKLINDHK